MKQKWSNLKNGKLMDNDKKNNKKQKKKKTKKKKRLTIYFVSYE